MRICDWSSDVCSSDLARHALDTRGDHGVLRAREHRLRGALDRLLRRAALAIERHRADAFGQARGEHRAAPDLKALLAALAAAAHDDAFYRPRLAPRPPAAASPPPPPQPGPLPSAHPVAP